MIRVSIGAFAVAMASLSSAPQNDHFFPPIPADASRAWGQYLEGTELRIKRELASAKGFLALDFTSSGPADRQSVVAGQMPIAKVTTLWPNGGAIDVPGSWVHHWRSAILLKSVRLDYVLERLREAVPGVGQGDVVKAYIRKRDGANMSTEIQVQRTGSVGPFGYHLVYNTSHDVTFARPSPTRATSTTVATKIAELYHPGTPEEREMKAGEDGGYLRRWNSYWRYEEVSGGVIAECESVTLSRDAPYIVGALGGRSIAENAARESMTRALINLQTFVRTQLSTSPAR